MGLNNPQYTLADAIPAHEINHCQQWYINYPQRVQDTVAQCTKPSAPLALAPQPRYRRLGQTRYPGQSMFYAAQSPVSFKNDSGEPIPLHKLLDKDLEKLGLEYPGWQKPWTEADPHIVGQKVTLRVRLDECSINKQINVRRFTETAEACTKLKLGHEIAKAVREQWSARIPFDKVVLYELLHVSQGSWQPVLGVKLDETATGPVSILPESLYDSGSAFCWTSLCRV